MGDSGDTCIENAGSDAPYVVVTSVFDGGVYRVMPGQRVMFEHGSLQQVVDQEKEPCGCPPPSKTEVNEFPLAESEGLAPTPPSPQASAIKQPAANDEAATTLVHNAGENTPQTVAIPPPPPAQIATTTASLPAQEAGAKKKPGVFRRIGRFFKRVFGAE